MTGEAPPMAYALPSGENRPMVGSRTIRMTHAKLALHTTVRHTAGSHRQVRENDDVDWEGNLGAVEAAGGHGVPVIIVDGLDAGSPQRSARRCTRVGSERRCAQSRYPQPAAPRAKQAGKNRNTKKS